MGGWSRTTRAALLALIGGGILLLAAEAEWLRVAAASALVAGIVLGSFALATPSALAEDPPPEEREPE